MHLQDLLNRVFLFDSIRSFTSFFCQNLQVTARFPNNVKKELEVSFYQVNPCIFHFYFIVS